MAVSNCGHLCYLKVVGFLNFRMNSRKLFLHEPCLEDLSPVLKYEIVDSRW